MNPANIFLSLLSISTAAQAAFNVPTAKVVRGTDFPYGVELSVGAQKSVVKLDNTVGDILLTKDSGFDIVHLIEGLNKDVSVDFENFGKNFKEGLNKINNLIWGKESISFGGSDITYKDVVIGATADSKESSIFGLANPFTVGTNDTRFWDIVQELGGSPSFSFGLSTAPSNEELEGWLTFGGVASSLFENLTTIPLIGEDQTLQVALSAVKVLTGKEELTRLTNVTYRAEFNLGVKLSTLPLGLLKDILYQLGYVELTTDAAGLFIVGCDELQSFEYEFNELVSITVPIRQISTQNDDGTCSLAIIPIDDDADTVTIAGSLLGLIYFSVDFREGDISVGQAIFPGIVADPHFEVTPLSPWTCCIDIFTMLCI